MARAIGCDNILSDVDRGPGDFGATSSVGCTYRGVHVEITVFESHATLHQGLRMVAPMQDGPTVYGVIGDNWMAGRNTPDGASGLGEAKAMHPKLGGRVMTMANAARLP